MITLTNISALRLWAHEGLLEQLGDPCQANGLNWTTGSFKEILEYGLESRGISYSHKDPLHVLVDDPGHRTVSSRVKCHVWSGRLPAGSLYQLAPGVLIASPAFCCLQDAVNSSLPHVAATMMECLGKYGRVTGARGFLDRNPLLGCDELSSYLANAKGCRGVEKARRALRLALSPTRSPLETKTVLIATLSGRLGGYGLPRPEVNYVISTQAEDIPFSQFARYEVDVCWPNRRTILEVDSYRYHAKAEQLDTDAKRRNSLKSMGWKVITVTDGQLSGDALDVLMRQVAKDLKLRLKTPKPELRDWLLEELP